MPHIGLPELIVILVVLLLLFGAKRLPELARSIGSSAKELKGALRDDDKADKSDSKDARR
ncbi:MAG: twin-arginine translocase TatA/TatE family subunit [Candidatus Saccharibacteria bacterium]|nr:twin-arginine translocase TatA/TatE family subunit [Candidatus Saccharibacteria bacterium]